jgi:hypothetical protein
MAIAAEEASAEPDARPPADAPSLGSAPLGLAFGNGLIQSPLEIVDVTADDQRPVRLRAPLVLLEGEPLRITFTLRPRQTLSGEVALPLRLVGAGGELADAAAFSASGMEVGGLFDVEHTLRQPRMRFTGRARLDVLPPDNADASPLFQWPVYIQPHPIASRAETGRREEVFGAGAVSLNASFRLGPEAAVTLECPEELRFEGLGLISALVHDRTPSQGEEVALVEVLNGAGRVRATAAVEAGVHTAFRWFDYYPEDSLEHERAPVFSSEAVDRTNLEGESFQSHAYYGRLHFGAAFTGGAVRITSLLDDDQLEIRDVLLLSQGKERADDQ